MRPTFLTRTIHLTGDVQRRTAIAAIEHAPTDADRPLEIVIREKPKARKPDQNALMWAGPLRDIAEQGWVQGRQYAADVWHEEFKRQYLPEDDDPNLPELAREGYRKWDTTPSGKRVLVGSTTQLTVKGFAQYLRQVEAFGAELGVMFHARAA